MSAEMIITLEVVDNKFNATANILPDKNASGNEFSFILNDNLHITEITCNGKAVSYTITSKETPEFRPLCKRIVVSNCNMDGNISIVYSGSVSYWHNIITRDFVSLSFYSVWYPQETSTEITGDKVYVQNGKDFFLVKGVYDEEHDIWEYGGKGFDPFNIALYRRDALKTISNPYMNIYYIDGSIQAQAEKSVAVYREIIDFYNGNLFSKIDIPVLDIACASPAITTGGGYRRKDFMWCTSLGNSDSEIAWLFAHETAHIWCSGADTCSWEDWLNETAAEWATILFALHRNDRELFDFVLQHKLKKYSTLPAIKTADGSRPEGVHEKGTVLFYEIYNLYGEASIRKALKVFTELESKDTFSFIQALSDADEGEIAELIREGISKS